MLTQGDQLAAPSSLLSAASSTHLHRNASGQSAIDLLRLKRNSDILQDVSLLSGGYPQRFGNRTGAEIDFRLREGKS